MNTELILKMVKPYLTDNKISFKTFKNLFSFLSRQEQHLVIDTLIANNIEFVNDNGKKYDFPNEPILKSDEDDEDDELDVELAEEYDEDFEILYDEDIFKDKNAPESHFVASYKDVKQSNEVLCTLIQQGNEQAKQDLCIKNKALVDKFAWAYGKKYLSKLSFDDLEQSGMIGLIKAAERFNTSLGYAFSTYATYWIRQSVVRDIYDTGFIIRLPVHMMEKINKIANLESKYASEGHNHAQCIDIISSVMSIPPEYVEYCMALKVNFLSTSSLNLPVGDEEDSELMEFIPSEEQQSIEDIAMLQDLRERLDHVLDTLTEREERVLRLRYGLDDGKARTLEEVGKEFNVTRERIRQIEARALRKLRQRSRSGKLRDFIEEN